MVLNEKEMNQFCVHVLMLKKTELPTPHFETLPVSIPISIMGYFEGKIIMNVSDKFETDESSYVARHRRGTIMICDHIPECMDCHSKNSHSCTHVQTLRRWNEFGGGNLVLDGCLTDDEEFEKQKLSGNSEIVKMNIGKRLVWYPLFAMEQNLFINSRKENNLLIPLDQQYIALEHASCICCDKCYVRGKLIGGACDHTITICSCGHKCECGSNWDSTNHEKRVVKIYWNLKMSEVEVLDIKCSNVLCNKVLYYDGRQHYIFFATTSSGIVYEDMLDIVDDIVLSGNTFHQIWEKKSIAYVRRDSNRFISKVESIFFFFL